MDWLRITLIFSVFFFHIGLVFSTHNWPVKNDVQYAFLKPIMGFLTLWRMPLLFLVSGIGTQLALGTKSVKQYVNNRSIKLLIPFIAGIFLLLPIQVYYERKSEYDSLSSLYHDLFNGLYPNGNFSLDHHLWFIKYLFLISILSIPFLLLVNEHLRSKLSVFISKLFERNLTSNWGALIIFLIWEIVNAEYRFFTVDVGRFMIYFFFFIIGMLIFYNKPVLLKLAQRKKFFLFQAGVAVLIISLRKVLDLPAGIDELVKIVFRSILLWSCSMAALGYCFTFFDFDNKYRKVLNEAIYPFYLIHQPIIIVTGFYLVQYDLPVLLKVSLLILLSLSITALLYFLVIRPFRITRMVFGLNQRKKKPYAIRYANYKIAKLFNTIF